MDRKQIYRVKNA
jgi:hypothetical protein